MGIKELRINSKIQPLASRIQNPESRIQNLVSRNSFSLIEISVATVVLALVFGGMVSVFSRGAVASRKTQQEAAASQLAYGLLEQFSDWDTLDGLTRANCATDGTVTNNTYNQSALPQCNQNRLFFTPAALNNISYAPTLSISDGPLSPTGLKRLDIAVSWVEGALTKNITVSTLEANY